MPEEQIRQLREQIEQVNKQIHDLGISLKGSETLSIVGMYQRLKEVEDCTSRCEHLIHKFKDEIEDDFRNELKSFRQDQETKMTLMMSEIKVNSTAITAALMEMHTYKLIFGIFKSKNFWRIAAIAFGSIALNKSWYWIVQGIKNLIDGL